MPQLNHSRFFLRSRLQVGARNISDFCSLTPIFRLRGATRSILLFVSTLLVIVACNEDRKLNEAINAHFLKIVSKDAQESLDLRSVIPSAWKKVCLGYFPYASKSRIEDEYQGKILGEFEVMGDSNWMLFGITENNEITQIVLDIEVSRYLADHFRDTAAKNCVPRDQAVLMAVHHEGKRFIHLGKP